MSHPTNQLATLCFLFLYLVLSKPSSFYRPRTSAFALFYSCWEKETSGAVSYYIIMRLGLVKCSRNVNNILIFLIYHTYLFSVCICVCALSFASPQLTVVFYM